MGTGKLCRGNLTNCGEVTCNGLASRSGGVEILLAALCYRNRDLNSGSYEPVGSKASLISRLTYCVVRSKHCNVSR